MRDLIRAERGNTVRVHYTGRLEDGTVFDTSMDRHPLRFTIGEGRVLAGVEQAVDGMRPGESKTVRIPMEDAYGPYREDMVVAVDRGRFPEELNLKVGQTLEVTSSGGQHTIVIVTDISDSEVTVDANHPLAGKDLILDLRLIEIF
jgi:peptidylprolyl isomerase